MPVAPTRPHGAEAPAHRRWSAGLRARATIGFGLTGFAVALIAAGLTYGAARGYLLRQREETAIRQAYVNARLARSVLRADRPDVRGFVSSLGGSTASQSVLHYRGEFFATSLAIGPDAVPRDLQRVIASDHAGHQRYRESRGGLHLAVGVPLRAVDAEYYELFSLAELEKTLELLARALATGVGGAALVAALVGWAAANRLVRPLRPIADAAEKIAGGALDTRLGEPTDRDLRRLIDAFNSMAAALEARVERETRFAADVSHELRSPLAAVSSALEIINRRREQLPTQVIEAFDVLRAKVALFQQMVLDLLEISRVDAGTAFLNEESIHLRHLVDRVIDLHGGEHDVAVEFAPGTPSRVRGDRRRLAQVLGNILDNASRYAGGTSRVGVSPAGPSGVRIEIDDRGPGIEEEEREAVFGRFARGTAGIAAGSTSGSGLGLALSAEHVRLHRGRIWVEGAPGGGARFVVELPGGKT